MLYLLTVPGSVTTISDITNGISVKPDTLYATLPCSVKVDLSVVHYTKHLSDYLYNNVRFLIATGKKWVTQKVHVISIVDLAIPYGKVCILEQIVRVADKFKELDEQNVTQTFTIVLGDEVSVLLNSRSFISNIDPLFLYTLLTCRLIIIPLCLMHSGFNLVDALLRR